MSWAHEDLLREKQSTGYDALSPQEKMARCKQKRREQVERWLVYDQSLQETSKIHFTYHRPRRKKGRQGGNNGAAIRTELVEKLAASKGGVSFLPAVALLEAVNRADVGAVKYMLKIGADPNSADEDGLTALHQACIDNCEEIVKLLLEYGSNVDCRDSEDWTPLHACTTCGHINIAKILLNHGADLLALNADLSMPYDICEDDSPMLEFIESQMEKRNISQEQINSIRAHPELRILQEVTSIWNNSRRNPQQAYTTSSSSSAHQQHITTSNNTTQATRKNLRNNNFHIDDPLHSNPDKCTLLHVAAANGYLKLCRALLLWKANVDCKDRDGWTPLHAACCWSQREVLQMLVENGADVNIRNKLVEKAAEVTDDQQIVAFLNHLVREQRQRRRAAENAQKEAAAAAAAGGSTKNETNPASVNQSFNRSQGSRRSARSQSFRRRSIRKGNKDSHLQSNSASNIENDEMQDPHTSEARLEAAFWRGEVKAAHQAGESTSSSERGGPQQKQQAAVGSTNVSPIRESLGSSSRSPSHKSPVRTDDNRATAAQRLGTTSPPGAATRTFNSYNTHNGQTQQRQQGSSPINQAAQNNSISFNLPPDNRNVQSPIPPPGRPKNSSSTGCCVIV